MVTEIFILNGFAGDSYYKVRKKGFAASFFAGHFLKTPNEQPPIDLLFFFIIFWFRGTKYLLVLFPGITPGGVQMSKCNAWERTGIEHMEGKHLAHLRILSPFK